MDSPVIVAERLSKQYRIGRYRSPHATLRDALYRGAEAAARGVSRRVRGIPPDHPSVWALRDVTFRLHRGEVLGVIGSNGAGKSTLLKILSRITEPTAGGAAVRGTLGALLEVGTGFHAELTGRENVYLSGAILGMRRRQIDARFEEIVEFAGVRPFIDTPVKHYSSGMYLRLAFSVAAHLDPDILIVDEVLAVGDAEFQRKCLGKMDAVAGQGRTVIFVSHDLEAVRRLCTRCILLEEGRISRDGPPSEVVSAYLDRVRDRSAPNARIDLGAAERSGTGEIRFLSATYGPDDGDPATLPRVGRPLTVELSLEADRDRLLESLTVYVSADDGTRLISADTGARGETLALKGGRNRVCVHFEAVHLAPGVYTVGLLASTRAGAVWDHLRSAFHIELVGTDGSGDMTGGLVPCRFRVST